VRYRLVHLNGSLAGLVRDCDEDEIVLGRDPEGAQLVFGSEDRTVSLRHASLTASDGVLLLRDLESGTGTFLAGADIEEAELVDGDVFELGAGGPRIRVEMEDGATIVTAAPPADSVLPSPPPMPAAAATGARPPGPGSKLRLTFTSGTREGSSLELAGSVFRMGRAQECAVWTPSDAMVSMQHAKVVRLPTGYVLIDLESTNGTYLNGRRIQRATLADGDIVGLGDGGPKIRIQVLSPERAAVASAATVSIPRFAELAGRKTQGAHVTDHLLRAGVSVLGRDPAAEIHLDSPIVSRLHARLSRHGEAVTVEDLDSANGTYLNGRRVARSEVAPGDLLVVGPFQLVVQRSPGADAAGAPAPRIVVRDTRDRARLDARGVTVRADGHTILQDISLSVGPGCFVAVIGPSGSGKSTLLSVLSGIRAATEGDVLLNGSNLHRAFAALKSRLGYVPQDDIVHRELTVEESLDYTARLRLPPDTSAAERDKRVAAVLATLELTERRDLPIHRLSGGQRKRVSIATELLTEPSLIFLDEPTSGLDPGLEEALMLLMRELSYKGKTIVLVTHTLENIDLCDSVGLVMDGRLAFFGPAAEAKAHFGIDHMVNLYTRLKEKSGEAWSADFAAPEVRRAPPAAADALAPEKQRRQGAGPLRQLAILTSRYMRTVTRDGRNAALLIAQAPLIAGLIGLSLLYGGSDIAYTKPKNTILFLLAMTAVWFGCSNAARELVKERAIYLRERMVNLGLVPYVLSKVVVLAAFALIQCVVLLFILDLWFGVPGSMGLLLGGMLLASLVGILLGLALSALVGSPDRAMTLLPILLIPQVLFTIPAVQMDMKGPAGIVARAMPTWWAYDLLRRVALESDAHASDEEIDARLQDSRPVLMTRDRFQAMVQQGYMLFQHRGAIETTWTASLPDALGRRLPAALGYWRPAVADALALLAFGLALLAAAIALQRRHDRQP
jgi:ABC transport system ATP-binding/permease protein